MAYKSSIAAFVLLMSVAAVAGAAPVWTVNSLNTIGCDSNTTNFATTVTGASGVVPERFRTIVDAGGLRYMDEDAGIPATNGPYSWSLYTSSSGGPTTAAWPIPPNIPITVDFDFISGVGGPIIFSRRITLSQCNGGTITGDVVLIGGAAAGIPTLGEWSLLALGLLVMMAGGVVLRRRPRAIG